MITTNIINKICLIGVCFSVLSFAQPKFEATNSAVGEFSRFGFGARGIAMGNAMGAVKDNLPVPFYNPSLAGFQTGNLFTAGYTVLTLDRYVNYLSFGRKFEFYSAKDTIPEKRKPRAIAGFAVGLINSGVNNIDGRDNQGFKTGSLSASENLVYVSLSNRFSEKVALGLNAKLYYYNLYEDVTSTALGFDLGVLYSFNPDIAFSFVLADLNAAYRWDTSPIYNQEGTISNDKFPTAKKIGASYNLRQNNLLLAAEFEWNNIGRKLFRIGAEYMLYENLALRAGIDKIHLYNRDEYPSPAFGFAYLYDLGGFYAGFDYAFTYENYSLSARHLINLKILF